MSLADEINSRGHWWIRIRPSGFHPDRLEYGQLLPVLQQSRVQLTGWDFPHLGDELIRGRDYIGFETDWFYYREVVAFWQSGLFAYLLGIREDWYERGTPTMWRPADTTPGRLLGLGDTVTTYTEVFEFAARLASTFVGDRQVVVAVDLHGLRGRQVYAENRARTLGRVYTAQIDRFDWVEVLPVDTLLTSASELALQKSRELFLRFGVEFDINILREIQSDTRKV